MAINALGNAASVSKVELRAVAKAVRKQLRGQDTAAAALDDRLLSHLLASPVYQTATTVGSYRAFGSEPDVAAAARDSTKRFAWPRTHAGPPRALSFHVLSSADFANPDRWEQHRFGQLEPAATVPELAAEQLDVVLVPGLVFDVTGNRLGYGLGYYDSFLPKLRQGAAIIGVTLAGLVVAELPAERHDVRMTHLLTETGLTELRSPTAVAAATSSQLG